MPQLGSYVLSGAEDAMYVLVLPADQFRPRLDLHI